MRNRPIGEDDLHAYVDERLEPARARQVITYLAAHPEAAERVAAYARQREALRAALALVAAEPVPAGLRLPCILERNGLLPSQWHRPLLTLAAAVLLLVGGMAGGWSLRGRLAPPQSGVTALAREAADSYSVYADDPVRPVELGGDARGDLQRWFSDRLRRPIAVPDLDRAGYRLLGGRLVATPHGPAGLFLYQDGTGARLGVLVRPMAIDRTARMARRDYGPIAGYTWADRGLGYSLVGHAASPALHPVANEVRRQILSAA